MTFALKPIHRFAVPPPRSGEEQGDCGLEGASWR